MYSLRIPGIRIWPNLGLAPSPNWSNLLYYHHGQKKQRRLLDVDMKYWLENFYWYFSWFPRHGLYHFSFFFSYENWPFYSTEEWLYFSQPRFKRDALLSQMQMSSGWSSGPEGETRLDAKHHIRNYALRKHTKPGFHNERGAAEIRCKLLKKYSHHTFHLFFTKVFLNVHLLQVLELMVLLPLYALWYILFNMELS